MLLCYFRPCKCSKYHSLLIAVLVFLTNVRHFLPHPSSIMTSFAVSQMVTIILKVLCLAFCLFLRLVLSVSILHRVCKRLLIIQSKVHCSSYKVVCAMFASVSFRNRDTSEM